ncbi:MAG: helix-turn-helix transcriptional regulator [Bacteroidota bacterium]
MEFGKRLQESRKKTGLSQEELACAINDRINTSIKRNTISNYENNVSRPDYDILRAMSEVLEISIDKLLSLKPEDYKSIASEDLAVYTSNKTLSDAERKIEEMGKTAAQVTDKKQLLALLNQSMVLNTQLLEHSKKLYVKNKQAIEFINKGLDME